MKKINVAVVMGGPSTEHAVSIETGKNVVHGLNRKYYNVAELVLSKNLELKKDGKNLEFPKDIKKYDIIFNALHGSFGEDGTLQAVLDAADIKYTGSPKNASQRGMDKLISQKMFEEAGLPTPKIIDIKKIKNLKEPIITKPRFGGSSIGVEIIKSKKDIEKIEEKTDIIAQKFIQGRELTCPVLEIKGKVIALPVIEIRPNKQFEFFDYQAKYTSGASEEIVPAPIPSTLKKKIQEMAIRAHNSLGCAVYSRTDFIVKNKQVVILEINTLPGLTKNSLLPKSAAAQGISFSELLDIIIESSLRKYQ